MLTAHERLIEALEALPEGKARDQILRQARRGVFHTYKSPVSAPKAHLWRWLEELGGSGEELARRVRSGEFDDLPDEEHRRPHAPPAPPSRPFPCVLYGQPIPTRPTGGVMANKGGAEGGGGAQGPSGKREGPV